MLAGLYIHLCMTTQETGHNWYEVSQFPPPIILGEGGISFLKFGQRGGDHEKIAQK